MAEEHGETSLLRLLAVMAGQRCHSGSEDARVQAVMLSGGNRHCHSTDAQYLQFEPPAECGGRAVAAASRKQRIHQQDQHSQGALRSCVNQYRHFNVFDAYELALVLGAE